MNPMKVYEHVEKISPKDFDKLDEFNLEQIVKFKTVNKVIKGRGVLREVGDLNPDQHCRIEFGTPRMEAYALVAEDEYSHLKDMEGQEVEIGGFYPNYMPFHLCYMSSDEGAFVFYDPTD